MNINLTFNPLILITMAKKRKLNSRNPKYNSEVKDTINNVLKRVLFCMVTPSNPYRKVAQKPIPVYGVWLK